MIGVLSWIALGIGFAYVIAISILITMAIVVATEFNAKTRRRR